MTPEEYTSSYYTNKYENLDYIELRDEIQKDLRFLEKDKPDKQYLSHVAEIIQFIKAFSWFVFYSDGKTKPATCDGDWEWQFMQKIRSKF